MAIESYKGPVDVVHGQSTLRAGLWKTLVLCLVVALPAVLQFVIVYRQRFSFPYEDDYSAILKFVITYQSIESWHDRVLYVIQAQHSDYKLIFEHLILILQLGFTHHINLAYTNAIGNSFVFLIAFVLWKLTRVPGENVTRALRRFVPISFLFFALTYWETLDWAMASLQNLPVVFWALTSIYLLSSKQGLITKTRFVFACLAGVSSACSSANGFLLLPVGLLGLLSARAYRRSVIWSCCFVALAGAYFYQYSRAAQHLSLYLILKRVLFFFGFLGGAASYRWPSAVLGMCILAVAVAAFRSRSAMLHPAVFLATVWILATGVLVAWVRGGAFYVASRYSLYSVLLLVFCYSFLSRNWKSAEGARSQRWAFLGTVWIAAAFCLVTDFRAIGTLGHRRDMVLKGMALYQADPVANSPMFDPAVDLAYPAEKFTEQALLSEAIRKGLYRP